MAYHCKPKFLSTAHDTYRHPFRDQYDYKYYTPQSNFPKKHDYSPDKGTKKWFQDYRRTNIEEKVLRDNLSALSSPVRPTNFSDKPDIALGARKQDRECLLPIIHNNPIYQISNRNPDQIRDRDVGLMRKAHSHRDQIKDMTGSLHKIENHFYIPFPSSESFSTRNFNKNYITDFPTHRTAATEFVFDKKREAAMVNHQTTFVCR